MKKALLILGLLAIAGSALATSVTVFEEDFEGLQLGDLRNQGYTPYVEANVGDFFCDITNINSYAGQSLTVRKIKGSGSARGGVWIPFTGLETYAGQPGCFILTYMAKANSNMGGVAIGNGASDENKYSDTFQSYWFANGNQGPLKNSADKEIVKINHNFEWKEYKYVVDSENGTIYKFTVGGVAIPEIEGLTIDLSKAGNLCAGVFEPPYGANNRTGVTVDNVKVVWSDDPMVEVDDVYATFDQEGVVPVKVDNPGAPGSASFEVLQGSWLTLDGETSGSITLGKGESKTLNFKADQNVLGRECGTAVIRFTYGTESKDITCFVQSGTRGAGWACFSCDFDSMEDGDILNNPGWVAAGTVNNCLVTANPVDPSKKCLKIGQAQALHNTVKIPEGCSELYDVKVSGRIYYPSESAKCDIYLGTNISPAGERQGEYTIHPVDDGLRFRLADGGDKKDVITDVAPYDQWVNFGYTFNTDVNNRLVRFVTFNGQQYEVNAPLTLGSGQGEVDYFTEFRNYTFGNTQYYLDNLKIELIKKGTVPEPAICGLLALVALFLRRK